ncbi:MAG: hypothetical protein AAGE52_42915 [Myxococcota bacterium]
MRPALGVVMKRPAAVTLVAFALALGATSPSTTRAEDIGSPPPHHGDVEASEGGRSPADDWSQLSPEAYRAERDRKEETVPPGVKRREARSRPDWLMLEDPNSVTKEDANRVHRGGMLLAAGIPATVAGAFAIGFGAGNECAEGFVGAGATMATIGMGLNIGGIVALTRASKKARRAERSRKHIRRMSGMAVGSTIASTVIIAGTGIGRLFGCD